MLIAMEGPRLKDPKCDVIRQACTQLWSTCDRLNFNNTSTGLFLKIFLKVVNVCSLHLVVHIFFKTLCLLYASSKKCMQPQDEQAINWTGYKGSTWWGVEQVAMPTLGGLVNRLHQQYWVGWWTVCMQQQHRAGWWTQIWDQNDTDDTSLVTLHSVPESSVQKLQCTYAVKVPWMIYYSQQKWLFIFFI